MSGCHRFQEELALLAGDDLGVDAWEVRAHLEGCAACRALVDDLRTELGSLRAVSVIAAPASSSLVPGVLAHLGAEAHDLRPAPRAPRAAAPLSLGGFARAAAVVFFVVAAGLLGVALMPGAPSGPASGLAAGPAGGADDQVLHVQRAAGNAVELRWTEDGRGQDATAGTPAYKVLASSSPVDFSDARPVEVAGHALVATMPLPAQRHPDRTVTFFRVE